MRKGTDNVDLVIIRPPQRLPHKDVTFTLTYTVTRGGEAADELNTAHLL